MFIEKKKLVRLSSWLILFLLQVLFIAVPVFQFWIRVFLLSFVMGVSTVLWIKLVERRPLRNELGLDENGVTLLMYMVFAVILVFFIRNPFGEATLLMGSALIVPVFEELFFRKYLLGSMVDKLPSIQDLKCSDRNKLLKQYGFPLIITSLMFVFVHEDMITALLSSTFINFTTLAIMVLRMFFGIAVGGLYLLKRKWIIPVMFHVGFNLSYFLFI